MTPQCSTKTVYVMVLKKVKLKVIILVKEFCYMTKRTTQKWKVPSYNDRDTNMSRQTTTLTLAVIPPFPILICLQIISPWCFSFTYDQLWVWVTWRTTVKALNSIKQGDPQTIIVLENTRRILHTMLAILDNYIRSPSVSCKLNHQPPCKLFDPVVSVLLSKTTFTNDVVG